MSRIFAPKEPEQGETRAALDPPAVKRLTDLGAKVAVESGIGAASFWSDDEYKAAGAALVSYDKGLGGADIVLRVGKPSPADVDGMKSGAVSLSFLDPFADPEFLKKLAAKNISAISMEMIPRSTLAQKMDALSSQANLAGYVAVITAAARLPTILPMLMTPAGTLSPARFFIIGIGVAGLQAIATAKRLGARVTAFDVRPEALEQAESLGAKALRIDLGDSVGAEQGYAKELTPEQLEKQRVEQARVCEQSDVVITTAKVFGRKPPVLIPADVVARMKPGSVIVDLAAETGGNVEGVTPGEITVTPNGTTLVGLRCFEGRVPRHATQTLAANFTAMVQHFWNKDAIAMNLNPEDPILKGCLLTHGGRIVHERFPPPAS